MGKERNRLATSGPGWYTVVPVFTARTGVPFSIFDSTFSLNGGAGYGIPRYVPSAPISSFKSGSAINTGNANDFTVLHYLPRQLARSTQCSVFLTLAPIRPE